MENVSENTADPDPGLQLPAVLDLKAAASLAAAFLARRGADLFVDAGEVQRIGGQCLQVLLSAKASWAEDDRELIFESPSKDFISALESFGAASDLLPHAKEPAQ